MNDFVGILKGDCLAYEIHKIKCTTHKNVFTVHYVMLYKRQILFHLFFIFQGHLGTAHRTFFYSPANQDYGGVIGVTLLHVCWTLVCLHTIVSGRTTFTFLKQFKIDMSHLRKE